ncbi:hypothetical protein [Halogeometricum luteum]|uniref:Uncharacterized protein n=1 Tax=Halogeometricum luteum TaxID=2950537 RepID=A0ABU2G788_9EURY|nr:hypothetical protein [Halogeometricum sp. S3BR5-2]MDS0296657.1 hypothetical protein [Halogeometricum sp. S3BR5-2]
MTDDSGENTEDPNASSQRELMYPFPPLSYYERKSTDRPPQPVPEFLNANYQYLTIAGVFAALVAYLSRITLVYPQPKLAGMLGAAIMFAIAFLVVINNAVIEASRAYKHESFLNISSYVTIAIAMFLIGSSLTSFFNSQQSATVDALDSLVGMVLIFLIIAFIRGKFTTPWELDPSERDGSAFGRFTRPIAAYAQYIGGAVGWIYFVGPRQWVELIGLPARPSTLPPDGLTLNILFATISLIILTAVIIVLAVVSHYLYEVLAERVEAFRSRLKGWP